MSRRRERTYEFIALTEEPFREKPPKSKLIDEWAKPLLDEVQRFFEENPNARAVKIVKFPEELRPREITYTMKGKQVRRSLSVAQQALPILGALFRTNADLKTKYRLQLSGDKTTINIYKRQQ